MDINNVIDTVSKITETIPSLYEDGLQSTLKESGNAISRIPRLINAVLAPLDIWIAKQLYNVEEIKKLLSIKLKNIDPEKLITPEPYIAVPAMQAISYAIDNETLRNMYANLLAKSMYSDTKDYVHPAFLEFIKQLSPFDVKVFETIRKRYYCPIVNLHAKLEGSSDTKVLTYLTDMDFEQAGLVPVSIGNLIRLNLIEIPQFCTYPDRSVYDSIYKSKAYIESIRDLMSDKDVDIEREELTINVTPLGDAFILICIDNEVPE